MYVWTGEPLGELTDAEAVGRGDTLLQEVTAQVLEVADEENVSCL